MHSTSRGVLVTALVASGIAATAVACAESTEDADSSGAAQMRRIGGRYKGSLKPPPGTTDNPLDIDLVVTAWKKVKADFYDTTQGYTQSVRGAPPPAGEVNRCLGACPRYYSDLVCHYYCWHPSYEQVSPNVRGCFTYLANGIDSSNTPVMRLDAVTQQARVLFYPEIYDYCLYAEKDGKGYDGVLNKNGSPPWDEAIINANKAAGRKIGVLKWVDDNEEKAFKHVMWTWYNPSAFKMEDQQKAINAFYGVTLANPNYTATDRADVSACYAKRPRGPFDASDGTHCSATKAVSMFSRAHPNHKAIDAYMQTL
jgi:hypothetical protein